MLGSRGVKCNVFKYLSFEHFMLKTQIPTQVVSTVTKIEENIRKTLIAASNYLGSITYLDSPSKYSSALLKYMFSSVVDESANTSESIISNVCEKSCGFGSKWFLCKKSTVGICWVTNCKDVHSQEQCISEWDTEFTTQLCGSQSRRSSDILKMVFAKDILDLYVPLNINSDQDIRYTHTFDWD